MKKSSLLLAVCLSIFVPITLIAPARAADDKEQTTGEGGRFLRYSSTQKRVELTPQERQSYEQNRDRIFRNASVPQLLDASRAVLTELGYADVELDGDFNQVQAELRENLIGDSRKLLRGLWKSKLWMPAKPDHQTTEAMVVMVPVNHLHDVAVRIRFRQTVWDSNGDSRTRVLSEAEAYQAFFSRLQQLGRFGNE